MSIQQAQNLINKIWADIQLASQKQKLIEAKKHPEKFRLDRTMNGNANYRYYDGGWVRRGQRIIEHWLFCWSVNTNIGGQYLTWVEISEYTPKGKWKQTKRIRWNFSDSKKDVIDTALRRRNNWRIDRPDHMEFQPRK